MTLDIRKYLANLIKKEAKISHFQTGIQAGKTSKLRPDFAAAIREEYGDMFLEDADYIIFFTKNDPWSDANIKTAFEFTDRALGKDANKLSKNDFKALPLQAKEQPSDEENAEASVQDAGSHTVFIKVTIK